MSNREQRWDSFMMAWGSAIKNIFERSLAAGGDDPYLFLAYKPN